MTRIHTLLLASLLALAITSCRSSEPESPEAASTPHSSASQSSAPESSGGVAYEPAYPADVDTSPRFLNLIRNSNESEGSTSSSLMKLRVPRMSNIMHSS